MFGRVSDSTREPLHNSANFSSPALVVLAWYEGECGVLPLDCAQCFGFGTLRGRRSARHISDGQIRPLLQVLL
jgi:hypothetical protein